MSSARIRSEQFAALNRCSHTTQLALEENGGLPRLARLEPCTHRHLTLLFLLEPDAEVLLQSPGSRQIMTRTPGSEVTLVRR